MSVIQYFNTVIYKVQRYRYDHNNLDINSNNSNN